MAKPSGCVFGRDGFQRFGNRQVERFSGARFGEPADLFGSVLWLFSPASEFVTGVVVPIDGGFSAYSDV